MLHGSEPVFIQSIIPELAIEALYECVLGGLNWLYELKLHPMLISPLIQCPAGELWTLIRSDCCWITPEAGNLIQYPNNIMPTNPTVCYQFNCLFDAIIPDRQDLDPPACR